MIKKTILIALLSLVIYPAHAQSLSIQPEEFKHPSQEYAPWVIWYWMFGMVSEAGVKADLEAMAEIGLGGAYLMPIKSPHQAPPGTPALEPLAPQLTPEWWDRVTYAVKTADSLGLELGFHICDGFALAGGPWITPELSMQRVVWSEQYVAGGQRGEIILPVPEHKEGYYRDIAIYALPVTDPAIERSTRTLTPTLSTNSTRVENNPALLIRPGNKHRFSSREACWIQYDFQEPFTLRSVEIMHAPYNYQAFRWTVTASDDGINYRPVTHFESPRFGWQNNDAPNTFTIPTTTARYFRMNWSPKGSEVGAEDLDAAKWAPSLGVLEMHLSGEPKVRQYEGKSGVVWRVDQAITAGEIPNDLCVDPAQIIRLNRDETTGSVDLSSLPAGRWRILRMGHTSTGHENETAGAGRGLECDKFNPVAIRKQFDGWFGNIYNRVGRDLASRVITTMHMDSWECGSQNWSANFSDEFERRRGYDLMPYLPLYAGIPLQSAEFSEKVLLDIRETIAELVVDVFYETFGELAKEYNCQFSAECVSPTMTSDGMMHYQKTDLPMGEFWLRSPTHDKLNDMLDAVHGAHIYGKNIIQAEGFTQLRTMWDEHPAMLKTMADRNYALGVNQMVYHVYVHNPWLDKKPGMTLDGIGLYFQRDQTWWSQSRAWVDYAKRCQMLLQQGAPVTDVAVFTGEDIPRRALMPDRLIQSLPGIFGPERVESERIRLANVGQPQAEMPVGVTHAAGTTRPEDWIDPLNGYAYDSFNKDVLLQARAENGKMVFPSGAAYPIVVFPLPDRLTMNDEHFRSEAVLAKIQELRNGGVTVLTRNEGLPYTADDFKPFGVAPDLLLIEAGARVRDMAWTHRRTADSEIYFLSNQANRLRQVIVSLRPTASVMELWNPVTGECQLLNTIPTFDRATAGLTLAANESVFIILRDGEMEYADPIVGKFRKQPIRPEHWQVRFGENEETRTWRQLYSWTEDSDPHIRYYSGTAHYQSDFEWNGSGERHYLDLGRVGVMAEVFVNGASCGVAWTPPYRVEVTPHLRAGKNELRIEVVNTWLNRMIGIRAGVIEDETVWVNNQFQFPDQLQDSGLLGPVVFITE